MDEKFSKLRFKEFAKAAAAGAIVGAVALQPTAARAFATNTFPPVNNGSWGVESSTSSSNGISNSVSLAIGQGSLSGEALVGAFDGALAWHVNPAASPPGPDALNLGGYHAPEGALPILVTETSTTAVGPAYTLAGLNVYVQLYFPASHAVARSILALQNTTGAPITVVVDNDSNLGTGMVALTSSGDATFDQTDNWFVTGTSATNTVVTSQRPARNNRPAKDNRPARNNGAVRPDVGGTLPAVTMAFRDGQDAAPSSTISAGKPGIFGNGGSAFFERYTVTVPPGATRAVMVFAQMSDNVADAEATAPLFNSGPTLLATDYMGSLPDPSNFAPFAVQQSDIVNWNFNPIPVPTLTQWAQAGMALLLGAAGLVAAGLFGRRRRLIR